MGYVSKRTWGQLRLRLQNSGIKDTYPGSDADALFGLDQKHEFVCHCGTRFQSTLSNIWKYVDTRKRFGCGCSKGKVSAKTWGELRRRLQGSGVKDTYPGSDADVIVGVKEPMTFICGCGRSFTPTPDNVWYGYSRSCGCSIGDVSDKIKEMKEKAEANGGRCLSDTYVDKNTHYRWRCKYGHEWEAIWANVRSGTWCKRCSLRKESVYYSALAETQNGLFRGPENVASQEKADWACEKGHEFSMRPNDVVQGHWCRRCRVRDVKAEIELHDFVKGLGVEASRNDRHQIQNPDTGRGLEIDVWVPSRNLAIEHCGLYFHSEARGVEADEHKKKALLLREKGISLLAVFEDEWLEKRPLIESMIKHRLGLCPDKIRASALSLRRLSSKSQWEPFFSKNHLDGNGPAVGAYALVHGDEVISCMSWRRNFSKELEISRFATKAGVSVPGAASKLFRALVSELKSDMVSFSSNRVGDGSVYKKLGFELVSEQRPSYWYTDFKTRLWRFKCRRINDADVLAQYPTEAAQARGGVFSRKFLGHSRPMYKIYDYGHRKWVFRYRSYGL